MIAAPLLFALVPARATAPADLPVYPGWAGTRGDLPAPTCVALEAGGAVWVGTADDHRVRRLDADGRVTVDVGGYGTGPGHFRRPAGLALVADGVAVSDGANHRVQVLAPDGAFLRELGTGLLFGPAGLAAAGGRLYVADRGNDRVVVLGPEGALERTLGHRGPGPGELLRPLDVAVDGAGRVWVADAGNQRVVAFEPDGEPSAELGTFGFAPGLFAGPAGLCARGGHLWVADRDNHRVQLFDTDGTWRGTWGVHAIRPREGEGKLHYPVALDVRPELELAVLAEARADRLQLFGPGTEDTVRKRTVGATGDEAPAPGSIPHFGRGAAADGDLLVTIQPETQSVQVLDLRLGEPVEITLFGGFGDGPDRFRTPVDVAVDAAAGRVWVLDRDARRLAVFGLDRDPGGALTQLPRPPRFVKARGLEALAGEAGLSHPVDPTALARAPDGRLFVADARNERVLELGPDLRLARAHAAPGQRLAGLCAVAVAPDGALWVAAEDEPAVVVLDPGGGAPVRAAGAPAVERPAGLLPRADGRAVVADAAAGRLVVVDAGGGLAGSIGGPGLGAREFHRPGAVVAVPGGFAVVDAGNHRLQFLDDDGGFVRAFGARLYTRATRAARGPR